MLLLIFSYFLIFWLVTRSFRAGFLFFKNKCKLIVFYFVNSINCCIFVLTK